MPFDDVRGFLQALRDAGQLLHVRDRVDPEPDLGAAACAAARLGPTAPGLLFTDVTGFSAPRIALNLHGSWANHALALDLPVTTGVREQVEEFARRWEDFPVAVDRRADPPFAEHTVEGDEIDLFTLLPLFRLNAGDGGFFLDKALVVSRDPDDPGHFGKQNVGIYRLQVKDRALLGLQPSAQHDIALHLRHAEERGEDLPVAIALGNEPVITITAGTPLAPDQSEYEMAGALRQAPSAIVAAPLTGIDVPWGAEVVLEGAVLCGQREFEGPFGEFTGHYSGGRRMPVVRIDRVSHRTDPVFEHLYLGKPWTEVDYLVGPSTCLPLRQELRADFPEVQAVNALYTHGLVAIVSTGVRYGGFAKAVGMRALTTRHGLGYCKLVIVVDADIDPFDLPQVMWAVSVKVDPAQDVVVVPHLSVVPLDPSSDPPGMTSKMVIDATTPVAPDTRRYGGTPVPDPPTTAAWVARLQEMLAR